MNYPQQSAQGLASLGRGNDSMLVHMTPNEVQGLQGLAMAHGGSLTVNPQTGLPEAGFLDFVLPVAGSFLGMPPWLTASLMAGKTLIEGGDLGDAAMAGLTSYGGAKIGEGLSSFGAAPKVPTSELNAIKNAPYTGVFGSTGQLGANMNFGTTASSLTDDLASSIDDITTKLPTNVGADALAKTQNFAPDFTNAYKSGIDLGTKDLTNLAKQDYLISPTSTTPTTGLRNLSESFAAKPVGVDIPGATTAASNNFGEISRFGDAIGNAAKDPVGFARHIGDGDALYGGAKIGMYGASPFMEDILKPQEYVGYEDPEKGKYTGPQGQLNLSDRYSTGLKLLPNLNQPIRAAQGGAINSYAIGGAVGNPSVGGGLSDLYNRPEGQGLDNISSEGYGIGRLNTLASQESLQNAKTLGYAEGGSLNLNELPTLNTVTGEQTPAGGLGGLSGMGGMGSDDKLYSQGYGPFAAIFPDIMKQMSQSDRAKFLESGMGAFFGMKEAPKQEYYTGSGNIVSMYGGSGPQQRTGDGKLISSGYAKGGYLNGQGDGMSDSIPATIEGKQPARLADGEFVIPADVVSHLGNGSSKAGSKRLYAMLDKVRHARTGNKKQGKQINPSKYMPA
jgi:hypothetical protein